MQPLDLIKQLPIRQRMAIFLAENNLKLPGLAKKIDCSYQFLIDILNRKRRAPEDIAKKIEAITQGFISYEELRKTIGKRCPTCGHKVADS